MNLELLFNASSLATYILHAHNENGFKIIIHCPLHLESEISSLKKVLFASGVSINYMNKDFFAILNNRASPLQRLSIFFTPFVV